MAISPNYNPESPLNRASVVFAVIGSAFSIVLITAITCEACLGAWGGDSRATLAEKFAAGSFVMWIPLHVIGRQAVAWKKRRCGRNRAVQISPD